MPRFRARRRRAPLCRHVAYLVLAQLGFAAAATGGAAASPSPAPRFAGLERLYFSRLEDPAGAVSSLRRSDGASPRNEAIRRLLPLALPAGEGPAARERVVDAGDGAFVAGLSVRDLPLPVGVAGVGAFLRQVVDRTHPRIHEQFWALYAEGRRTDLWFFSPAPDRTESKLLAPLILEEVRQSQDGLIFRASGAMLRPQGAGSLHGVDLLLATSGEELEYRYNVRRYSFTYGHDVGEGRSSLATVEAPLVKDGRTVLVQRLAYDVARDREIECGVDPELDFPSGTFEELLAIATCLTSPPAATRERGVHEPSFIERGGEPTGASAASNERSLY